MCLYETLMVNKIAKLLSFFTTVETLKTETKVREHGHKEAKWFLQRC